MGLCYACCRDEKPTVSGETPAATILLRLPARHFDLKDLQERDRKTVVVRITTVGKVCRLFCPDIYLTHKDKKKNRFDYNIRLILIS